MLALTGGAANNTANPPIIVTGTKTVKPSRTAARCLCCEIFVATGTTYFSNTA